MNDLSTATATGFRLSVKPAKDSGLTNEARANRELLLKTYQALEAGGQGALAAILDPDVAFFEAASLPYGVSARGVEATLQGVGAMLASWSSIEVEIEEFTAAGELVIAYMQFTGVSRDTGKIYSGVCAEVFRFKAAKIIEWRPIYWDTHAAREACMPDPAV